MIGMSTDRPGGITYTWPNLNALLNNQLQSVQHLGDLSAPKVALSSTVNRTAGLGTNRQMQFAVRFLF